jgi:hypothetical protein
MEIMNNSVMGFKFFRKSQLIYKISKSLQDLSEEELEYSYHLFY